MSFDLRPYLELDRVQYDVVTRTPDFIVRPYKNEYVTIDGKTGRIAFGPSDASQVIQSAIDATPDGSLILIKAGVYSISKPIEIKSRKYITIAGEGRHATILNPTEDFYVFEVSGSESGVHDSHTIRFADFSIAPGRSIASKGISVKYTTDLQVYRVWFQGIKGTAVYLEEVWASIFVDCLWLDCGDAETGQHTVHITSPESRVSTTPKFIGCWWENCYGTYVYAENTRRVKIIGCYIHPNFSFPGNFDHIQLVDVNGAEIVGNTLSASGRYGIVISGTSKYITISGNEIGATATESIRVRDSADRIAIVGNVFNDQHLRAIDVDTSGVVVVAGNSIYGSDNSKTDVNGYGIVIRGGIPVIVGNHVEKFYNGIFLWGSETAYIENFIIANNRIKDCYQQAMPLSYVRGGVVEGNVISDVTEGAGNGITLYYGYNVTVKANEIYNVKNGLLESTDADYNIFEGNVLRDIITSAVTIIGANTKVRNNIGYLTENSGTTSITGDGTTITFTVDVAHGLVSDKISAKVACKKPASYRWWLVDTNSDGFYETLRIEITFDTAPAADETVEIYWTAEVVG